MRRTWALLPAIATVLLASAAQADPSNGDPAESLNRVGFAIYEGLDAGIIRPAALAYQHAVPGPVRRSIENLLTNLHEPVVAANDLLQGRFKKARAAIVRFAVNSTDGVGGLFDVAARLGVPHHENGFALTLGRAGIRPGPYLFIPIAGPSTLRDAIGNGVDALMDPFQWFVGAHLTTLLLGRNVVNGLDERASADAGLQALLADATDPYATLRSVYLQNQQAKIEDRPIDSAPVLPSFDEGSAATGEPTVALLPSAEPWTDERLADIRLDWSGFPRIDTAGAADTMYVREDVGGTAFPTLFLTPAFALPLKAETTGVQPAKEADAANELFGIVHAGAEQTIARPVLAGRAVSTASAPGAYIGSAPSASRPDSAAEAKLTPRAGWGIGGGPVDISLFGARFADNRQAGVGNDRASAVGVECEPVAEPSTFAAELHNRFGAS